MNFARYQSTVQAPSG